MRYKELGDSGLQISAISLGSWGIGGAGWGEISKEASIAAIRTAIEHGCNTIDTAPVYGFGDPSKEDFGYGFAEVIIREAIEGLRDKLVITTKCGLNYDRSIGPRSLYKRMTKDEIITGCEGSLKRLGTDYIDVLFIHWPDNKTPLEEALEGLRVLMEQGKIRHYGLSNFTLEDTLRADEMMHVATIQPQYSMVARQDEPLMQAVKARGIGTMTYGSLGSGILTGAYRTLPNFDARDTRVTFYDYFKEPKFSRVMQLLQVMDEIAAQRGVPVSHVAINWSTQKEFVDTAIMGCSKPSHAVQNCAALDWSLTDEELRVLDQAIDRYMG